MLNVKCSKYYVINKYNYINTFVVIFSEKMVFSALDRIPYNTHLPEVHRFTQKYFLKRTLIRGKYNALASDHKLLLCSCNK